MGNNILSEDSSRKSAITFQSIQNFSSDYRLPINWRLTLRRHRSCDVTPLLVNELFTLFIVVLAIVKSLSRPPCISCMYIALGANWCLVYFLRSAIRSTPHDSSIVLRSSGHARRRPGESAGHKWWYVLNPRCVVESRARWIWLTCSRSELSSDQY